MALAQPAPDPRPRRDPATAGREPASPDGHPDTAPDLTVPAGAQLIVDDEPPGEADAG